MKWFTTLLIFRNPALHLGFRTVCLIFRTSVIVGRDVPDASATGGHGYGVITETHWACGFLSCLAREDCIELALREAGFCAVVRQAEVLLVYLKSPWAGRVRQASLRTNGNANSDSRRMMPSMIQASLQERESAARSMRRDTISRVPSSTGPIGVL